MENKPDRCYVIQEEEVEEDFLFGHVELGKEVLVPDGDWTPWKPTNEKQRQGFESMACTDFSSTSDIEIQQNFKTDKGMISDGNLMWANESGYIDENGNWNFSDRFDATMSGTGLNGNSLKNPAKAKSKFGLIPESMHPWTDNRNEYFSKEKITQEMLEMGQEFLKRFNINYERVKRKDFAEALKYSPLSGALYAWNGVKDGVYYRVDKPINHAIVIIKPDWSIFDSYNPFIKRLAKNYIFLGYAYRYIITENVVEEEPQKPPIDNDMLKTIQFAHDKRIFILSNSEPKTLIWINDPDGSSWKDYQNVFRKHNLIVPQPEVLPETDFPKYKIVDEQIHTTYHTDITINPFGQKLIDIIISMFGKNKR